MKRLIRHIIIFLLLALPIIGAAKPRGVYRKPCRDSSGRWGFQDKDENWVIPPKYEQAKYFSEGLAAVRQNGKWGYIERDGKLVIPFQFANAGHFADGLAPVQLKAQDYTGSTDESAGKYGYINRRGKLKIPPLYEGPWSFYKGRACVGIRKGDSVLRGFIDKKGRTVILFELTYIDYFPDDIGLFFKEGQYFFLYPDGKSAYPAVFEYYLKNHISYHIPYPILALREKKDNRLKYGVLGYDLKTLIPFQYDSLVYWNPNLYIGKMAGKWGVIHIYKGEVKPFEYQDAVAMEMGNCFALKDTKGWSFYDSSAQRLETAPIDSFVVDDYGLICYKDGKAGFWHKFDLKWTIPPVYEYIDPTGLKIKAVKSHGKYGFFDIYGKQLTPFRFDTIKEEIMGFSPIRENNLWGYFDWNHGRILTEPQYDSVSFIIWKKRAEVRLNSCRGIINDKGSIVIPLKYDRIQHFGDSLFIVSKDSKYGLADYNGKILTEPSFTKVYPVKHPLMRVEINGKTGYINKKGLLVIPSIYAEGTDFQEEGYVSVRLPGSDQWIKLDVDGREVE